MRNIVKCLSLCAVLLLIGAAAVFGQGPAFGPAAEPVYDAATGWLSLPVVAVGGKTYANVTLRNTGNFRFALQTATEQTPPGASTVVYDAASGVLTIPYVRVGAATYVDVTLRNVGNYVFSLLHASEQAPYFVEVANAMPDLKYVYESPAGGGAGQSTVVAAFDIDGDGRDDLIFHFWQSQFFSPAPKVGSTPCANRLVVLTQQADGTFVDSTARVIRGSTSLGGCSRKSRVVDVNGDGRPDILYAINQEDGRDTTNIADSFAQLAALISNPDGTYSVRTFGSPNWYHSVGFGYEQGGQVFIAGQGFDFRSGQPQEAFVADAAGIITPYAGALPRLSPSTFEFYSDSLTDPASKFLVQADNNLSRVEGHARDGLGRWTALTPLASPYPVVATVTSIGSNGSRFDQAPVMDLGGGVYSVRGVFSESCVFRSTPISPPIVVLKAELAIIRNYVPGVTTVVDLTFDVILTMRLIGVKVEGGAIVNAGLNIPGEQNAEPRNFNFFDCRDVDGDGYADIVEYQYLSGGQPTVYLNNRNGGFQTIPESRLPARVSTWGSASSLIHDFNHDGLPDLVIWPPNGVNLNLNVSYDTRFRFFRAVRPLSQNAP